VGVMSGLQLGRPITLVLFTGCAPECTDRLCGPPVLLSKVYRGAFPVDNAPGKREADHTAPSHFGVKYS
jgi:hypothetical protein